MTAGPVVSDSSPLIALQQIGRLELLRGLFVKVLVPPAVVRETRRALVLPDWVCERGLRQPISPLILAAQLGPGESEALALATEISAHRVILDDRAGRNLAARLALPMTGAVGILLAAKRRALLSEVKPELDALLAVGFYIGPRVYRGALAEAQEP